MTSENIAFDSKSTFCESLFHVYPSPERGTRGHLCLQTENELCDHRQVALVVKFDGLTATYFRIGTTHAEKTMAEDLYLQEFIRKSSRQGTCEFFIKFQPCHQSGGNARFFKDGYGHDERSCTDEVIRFYKQHLEPNNIQLEIKIASLYKADWALSQRPDDIGTVENARNGLEMLIRSGIDIYATGPDDWDFLASLCKVKIPPEILHHERRIQADRFTTEFLCAFKQEMHDKDEAERMERMEKEEKRRKKKRKSSH